MNTCLIAIDGVIRKLIGAAPITAGMRLYHSLASTGQVVLLGDTTATGPDSTALLRARGP